MRDKKRTAEELKAAWEHHINSINRLGWLCETTEEVKEFRALVDGFKAQLWSFIDKKRGGV